MVVSGHNTCIKYLDRFELCLKSEKYIIIQFQPPMHDKEKVWGGPAPETAFLGPQIWDKKLPMKVFNQEPGWPQQQHPHHGVGGGYHSAGRDSNDSTPSPPRYIEVSEIQVHKNIDC